MTLMCPTLKHERNGLRDEIVNFVMNMVSFFYRLQSFGVFTQFDVVAEYASTQPVLSKSKGRFFARLASEIFLSSLQTKFQQPV
jgi:hypothetical protein